MSLPDEFVLYGRNNLQIQSTAHLNSMCVLIQYI